MKLRAKTLLSVSLLTGLIFGLNGCLEKKELARDELITIYDSNFVKTRKLNPLDTMYIEVAAMEPNKRYKINILDSDKNLITNTEGIADDDGVIQALPTWYDVGLERPNAEKNYFHVSTKDLELKAFYVNIVDLFDNGNNTNFEQPFFIVTSSNKELEYKKPIVYACKSTGEIENKFEETGSKNEDGTDSDLTKIYLKADVLPAKTYASINDTSAPIDVKEVDIYIIPFKTTNTEDFALSDFNASEVIKIPDVKVTKSEDGKSTYFGKKLIWDLNGDRKLMNPNNHNNAYSIIIDVNQDGEYTNKVDVSETTHYIDGADGIGVAGFIISDTPANNPQKPFLTNENGDKTNSVPEKTSGEEIALYLNLENIATNEKTAVVTVSGTDINEEIDIKSPKEDDKIRFLKYIEDE